MITFGWPIRLKYGALAAAAGWLAGWVITFPFELSLALRYVDGHTRQLPGSLAEGMMVWAAFRALIRSASSSTAPGSGPTVPRSAPGTVPSVRAASTSALCAHFAALPCLPCGRTRPARMWPSSSAGVSACAASV